jgi:hypothetical protein
MRDDQHFCTAIHEAAHCIVAHELGAPVLGAHVGIHRGYARIEGLRGIDAAWRRCGDYRAGDTRAAAWAKIQICLAGPVGQAIHNGSAHGNDGDALMIEELRQRFDISDERIKRLRKRTWRLLLDNWGSVIRLAARLEDAGTLDRDEIEAILDAQ